LRACFGESIRGGARRLIFVEERHLLGRWPLKHLGPLLDVFKGDRGGLCAATANSKEKKVRGSFEEVKFDGGTEVSCADPKGVALRPRPGSPLDHDAATEAQDLLSDLPLKLLDSLPGLAIPEVDAEIGHPLVGAKANCMHPLLNLHGVRGFSGAGKAANDDESGTSLDFADGRLLQPGPLCEGKECGADSGKVRLSRRHSLRG
jgi:hypothetical protein